MSLYRVSPDKLEPVAQTKFAAEKVLERRDLQRLLRADITPLGSDLLVIAEEFGDWEDSNRRIDLLCLNQTGDLVVIELKRTEDGGHMDLQAIRYAAMVSSMTLDQAVHAYARAGGVAHERAREEVLAFLRREASDAGELTGDVRILLVSADFSTELTTSVLWLNRQGLDVTCVRFRPYRIGDDLIIDATQIIPLPEATDYEVRVRAQEKEKRKVESAREELLRQFWEQLIARSRGRTALLASRNTTGGSWLTARTVRGGFGFTLSLVQKEGQVECYIRLPGDAEKTSVAFETLHSQREKIEGAFGETLDWQALPDREGCRICVRYAGGWKSPEAEWSAMQDRMIDALIRLERALMPAINDLKL